MNVSIVINTLNRATLLPNTLQSILQLEFDDFEVIVVNGPSTDGTTDVLEKWKDRIKIGGCPLANLAVSRNIGIAMSAGDVIAFIDDDAIPEPEWLDQIVQGFNTPEVAAVGGKVFDHTGYTYQYEYANANRLGHGKWRMTTPSPHYCFPGAFEFPYLQGTNTAFRRSALLEIGGFDEEFAYYLDETDVCLRLIDRGYVIKQLSNAYVHHKFAPSHIRTESVAIYRYPVLKSKVYFSNRHALPYCSQEEIDSDNQKFMDNHRKDVINCVNHGRLGSVDLENFEKHVVDALSQGKQSAYLPPKLINDQLLKSLNCQFKKFRTDNRLKDALTLVLLCEDYPPNLLGGIARFTQDKATALARLGHKVHVIARSLTHNMVDLENGVWVHRIVVTSHQIPCDIAEFNIPQSHWDQSQSFLNEIDRINQHHKVDLIEAPIWNIVGIAPLKSGRYPLVTSLMTTLKLSLGSRQDLTQNVDTMDNFVKPLVALEKYLIEESHAILAISNGIVTAVNDAYDINLTGHRLQISYLGMPDWSEKTVTKNNTDSPKTINILFVGRMEKRKGIDLLLEIAPSICARFPNVRFHVVGDDSIPCNNGQTYRNQFEQQHARDISNCVHFYGKVDENTLREHYANCDLFVAPSRFESFGLIYLEAMMYGKPTIGCSVGGVPEVVMHEATGLLVEPDNADALRDAVETLVLNEHLRKQYGHAGRIRYEALFSDKKMAQDSVRIYRNVLANCLEHEKYH